MNKPIQKSIQEAVQKAWSEAVSRLQTVEDEVGRRFRQAVDRADQHLSTEEIQRQLSEFGKRLQQNTEALGQRIEENVRTVVGKVRGPLIDELASLKTQAEALSHRIESQLRRRGGKDQPPGGSSGSSGPAPG